MLSPRASVSWALAASTLLHFAVVSMLSEVDVRGVQRPTPRDSVLAFEPVVPSLGARGRSVELPEVAPGSQAHGALDRDDDEGRGGELYARERSALLFPFASPLTLQDSDLNNLAVNQVQRIRTSSERATLEERRASPHADDAVLLVSGERGHLERRAPAAHDAARGAPTLRSLPRELQPAQAAPESMRANQQGTGGGTAPALTALAASGGSTRAASFERVPARGIVSGRGTRERLAARVSFARPNVDRAAAATPAEQISERVRDDADSELLAAKLQRSFVDTSVQRARQVGAGSGGMASAPNALGELGQGTGAKARPYTPGPGSFAALDTSDARYLRWFTEQRARVQRELVFPRERALRKDQGTSLYKVVLARDGGVHGSPRLVRSSGFADFDRAAGDAIARALPFSPLPAELAPELDDIALLIPVAFANPMVE